MGLFVCKIADRPIISEGVYIYKIRCSSAGDTLLYIFVTHNIATKQLHTKKIKNTELSKRSSLEHVPFKFKHTPYFFLCSCTVLIILSTTPGSASVLISPNWSSSPAKIFRKIRLIILPDRVLGKSSTMMMFLGAAKGPIALRTWRINSLVS